MQIGNGFADRPTAGGPALGTVGEVSSPTLVEVYGDVGFGSSLVGYELGAARTVLGEWIDAFDGGDR
jgi:hypothetical protein